MKREDLSTKETILNTILSLMKNENFQNITVREIAKQANVNVALINYHFGSKENLINEALKILLSNVIEVFSLLDDETHPPKEKLYHFLLSYYNILSKYSPYVKRIVLQNGLMPEFRSNITSYAKNVGLKKFTSLISEITKITDPSIISIITIQMIGALIFPHAILPSISNDVGINFSADSIGEQYVKLLIQNFLGNYENNSL